MPPKKAKSKILLIGNFLSGAGFSRGVCEDLAIRLEMAGWRVITTSHKPGRLYRLIDMVKIAWGNRDDYQVAHIDVFSGPSFLWAEFLGWILRKAQKPFVLTLRGGNLPSFATRWPWRVYRLLRSANAVTTPSRYLLEAMGPYRQNINLLPNPLDLAVYPFRLRVYPRPHIIWLRAFHSVYNPGLAPRVLAALLASFPNASLTMVGPDKGDGSLRTARRFASDLGVLERMEIVRGVPKEEVPHWLNIGDIFINTTNVDNTPVSVIEAMACGMCVVSTNVGGIPYLLEDGLDALLVPPEDPEAMAFAVTRILIEPGLAAQLSENARRKAELHDWGVVLPQWRSLFEQVHMHA